jgi:hypothetical protein
MDLTPIDDIVTRLRALRLTAEATGLDGAIFGRLFTDELPRLEALRGDLERRFGEMSADVRRLETSLGQTY